MVDTSMARPMFEFPVKASDLFAERAGQIVSWGIAPETVASVADRVDDVWFDGPGGWTFEWCGVGRSLEADERWLEASFAYAAARFPCLATPARIAAYERHIELFLRGTTGLVDRQLLEIPYRSSSVLVPAHYYRAEEPLATLVLTGGVDTWKTELHRLASRLSRHGPLDVVTFDMPGTGESTVPLAGDADEIYRGVVDEVRAGRPAGVMGVSFGGHWAAKLALHGGIDFAVDLGGPTGATGPPEVALDDEEIDDLPNGMSGILAHALHLSAIPTIRDAAALLPQFSLYHTLVAADARLSAPLLAINGVDDVYIPPVDVEVFEPFDGATVWLVDGAGHCAFERFREVQERIVSWLHETVPQLTERTWSPDAG